MPRLTARESIYLSVSTNAHTHTTLNLWELCVCVCAPYPKLYNMKKARSKVRTTSFLCSFKARGCILELAGRNPSSNQTSLVTKPPFDCIWFEGIFTAQSREVRTFTRPRAVDQVSVMHLMKNMFSRSTWLLSAYLCQIWDKSFKRSTKEAFTSSYYSNLSSSDGCVLHKRTALACVTATREKATLQGTINSKHNRYTKRERRWGPAAGMLTFQRFVWKSGRGSRLQWVYKISVTLDLISTATAADARWKVEVLYFCLASFTAARSREWLIWKTHAAVWVLQDVTF